MNALDAFFAKLRPCSLREIIAHPRTIRVDLQNVVEHLNVGTNATEDGTGCRINTDDLNGRWPWPLSVASWRWTDRRTTEDYDCAVLISEDEQARGLFTARAFATKTGVRELMFEGIGAWKCREDGSVEGLVEAGDLRPETRRSLCVATVALVNDGSIVGDALAAFINSLDGALVERKESALHYMIPMLFAARFIHCKNVRQSEIAAPPVAGNRAERRAAAKRLSYRVLVIDPEKTPGRRRVADEGDAAGPGVSRHICRGHFARYTPERPLFGKYSGTYWIPQHVRGSEDVGEVLKDYRVGAGS